VAHVNLAQTTVNRADWLLLGHKWIVYALPVPRVSFHSLVEITGSPVEFIEIAMLGTALADPDLARLLVHFGLKDRKTLGTETLRATDPRDWFNANSRLSCGLDQSRDFLSSVGVDLVIFTRSDLVGTVNKARFYRHDA